MANFTGTPKQHQVFNPLDRIGILLGLPRLEGERNADYKRRLLDVHVRRASSTRRGLLNAISRELGLDIEDTMYIATVLDGNGDPLVPNPAFVFEETKCILYNDYTTDDILLTLDRFEYDGGAWTLGQLRDIINSTGVYVATLTSKVSENQRSMTIFDQSNVIEVPIEQISGSSARIVLNNNNLIPGTVSVTSNNLTRLVATEADIRKDGDYTILHKEGTIITRGGVEPGARVRYSYRNDYVLLESSPVILHTLQSDDFQSKMFVQTDDGDDSLPTPLGASIINELLTVYPANWGK